MLIDPKTITLDANDREVVALALTAFISQKRRARKMLNGHDETSRKAIDKNEMQTARAEDVLARLGED